MKEWHIPPKEALPKPPLLFFLLEPDDEQDTSYFAPLVKMVNLFSSIIPTFYYAENEKSNKCSCFIKIKDFLIFPKIQKKQPVRGKNIGKIKKKMADIIENQEAEEMTAADAILRTVQQLAEKCETLEEFREALEQIIAKNGK